MSQDWEQIALSGTHLSREEAASLEALVKSAPKDLPSRVKLMGYLRNDAIRQGPLREQWEEQVLWFIKHHPDNPFVGTPFCNLGPDSPAYPRATELWNRAIDPENASPEVLFNGARFFTLWDPERTRALLERGERIAPDRPEWARHLGENLLRGVKVSQTVEDQGKTPRYSREERKPRAAQALAHFERALTLAPSARLRLCLLESCAKAAYEAGDGRKAGSYADDILALAPQCPDERHRPDYVHSAHIIRGMNALDDGDVKAALRELQAAGRQGSPHAPVLKSFGPNLRLAQRLLAKGDKDAVLAYLDQCATFWKKGDRIAKWKGEIERGGRPLMFTGYDPKEKQ